jgi:hypothetical protein
VRGNDPVRHRADLPLLAFMKESFETKFPRNCRAPSFDA